MTDKPSSTVAKVRRYTPKFPEELGPVARSLWDRLMPALIREDHFKPGDEIGLLLICSAYAQWLAASAVQEKRLGVENQERQSDPFALLLGRKPECLARRFLIEGIRLHTC